jgi:hypothetical protein
MQNIREEGTVVAGPQRKGIRKAVRARVSCVECAFLVIFGVDGADAIMDVSVAYLRRKCQRCI